MDIADYYTKLSQASGSIMETVLSSDFPVGQTHQAIADLDVWRNILSPRPESQLLGHVNHELQTSMYALLCGMYRQSFASLRLCCELSMGLVYFSVNRLHFVEWQQGETDIKWSELLSADDGVLSKRYCKAFFPDLVEYSAAYQSIAKSLYRELSEFVHGNPQTWSSITPNLQYKQSIVTKWFEKFDILIDLAWFTLSLRFAKELKPDELFKIEEGLSSHLGHIEPIRDVLALRGE